MQETSVAQQEADRRLWVASFGTKRLLADDNDHVLVSATRTLSTLYDSFEVIEVWD